MRWWPAGCSIIPLEYHLRILDDPHHVAAASAVTSGARHRPRERLGEQPVERVLTINGYDAPGTSLRLGSPLHLLPRCMRWNRRTRTMRGATRTALVLAALTRRSTSRAWDTRPSIWRRTKCSSACTAGDRDDGSRRRRSLPPVLRRVRIPRLRRQAPLRHGWLPPIIYYAIAVGTHVASTVGMGHPYPSVLVGRSPTSC
jgi:hypothetical protein